MWQEQIESAVSRVDSFAARAENEGAPGFIVDPIVDTLKEEIRALQTDSPDPSGINYDLSLYLKFDLGI